MNNGVNGVTSENLMRALPRVLEDDETMRAFAKVFADEMVLVKQEAKQAIIYNRIDMLPEAVLDALAYDFKVDWYDYDADIGVKRKLIKNSVNVHRMLGTRFAVESALSDLYSEAAVQEWFEYEARPYHFRLRIKHPWESERQVDKIIQTVERTKSKRSRLDTITFASELTIRQKPMYIGFGLIIGGHVTICPPTYEVPNMRISQQIGVGIAVGGAIRIKRGEEIC